MRALEDNLVALARDGAKRPIRVDDLPRVENSIHRLRSFECKKIAHNGDAEITNQGEERERTEGASNTLASEPATCRSGSRMGTTRIGVIF